MNFDKICQIGESTITSEKQNNFKCNHHDVKFDINKCHTHCFYTKIKHVFITMAAWKFMAFNATFF